MRRGANADGSKLRASRVRRQRDRERSLDGDELEQRFGRSLSLSAPVFVPAAQRAQPAQPAANRSMAFVTERRGTSAASCRPKRSATAAAAAKLHKNIEAKKKPPQQQQNTKPRRQRMGAKGLKQQKEPQTAASMRRKLSLTATELETPEPEQDKSQDEVYPETAGSAFPQQLTLFSQQKRLPQRVASRDDVIDTIFKALFARSEDRRNRPRQALSAFGDDTGTDTDEPNEEFVKRGLANALFKDQINLHAPSSLPPAATPAAAADRLITPTFMRALVNALRFEDFRTASARLDIVRAIHK
ncbi:hypothetical protein PHMEG_00037993, partial [Phytophthora megakarya]